MVWIHWKNEPQKIVIRMEGITKRVRLRTRWTAGVEDLKITEIRNWHTVARNCREWRSITDCSAWEGGGGGGGEYYVTHGT
jgi:hypothetical protein